MHAKIQVAFGFPRISKVTRSPQQECSMIEMYVNKIALTAPRVCPPVARRRSTGVKDARCNRCRHLRRGIGSVREMLDREMYPRRPPILNCHRAF